MNSTTADFSTNAVISAPETSDIAVDFFERAQPRFSPTPILQRGLSNLLVAIAAFTTTNIYVDPSVELLRSATSPVVWQFSRRRGRRISLREARDLALQIFEETERNLQQERLAEANFLLKPWEHDS